MKKLFSVLGTTVATVSLGLGAGVLPASAAAPATASWDHSSSDQKHQIRDTSQHNSQQGWWDSESRWHKWDDGSGWRDDNGNWRSDDDHNGSWTGRDGKRHDRDGWTDDQGQRHNNKDGNQKNGRTW
jgi:hypothetical protein